MTISFVKETQLAFTYSKLTTETLEQGVKYVQLTIKTPERRQRRSGVFIVNFEHISHLIVNFENVIVGWEEFPMIKSFATAKSSTLCLSALRSLYPYPPRTTSYPAASLPMCLSRSPKMTVIRNDSFQAIIKCILCGIL